MNILILEDDLMLRKALGFHLLDRGHTVSAVGNGKDALAILEKNHDIDMIVCDLLMPEMSGPSFLMSVRKVFREKMPVITIITSVKEGETFLEKLEVKYDHYLPKPLDFGRLDEIVDRLSART